MTNVLIKLAKICFKIYNIIYITLENKESFQKERKNIKLQDKVYISQCFHKISIKDQVQDLE